MKGQPKNTINSFIQNTLSFLDNKYISTTIKVFLILYASMIAPRLPSGFIKLFDNTFFKFIMLFLIAYIGIKDTKTNFGIENFAILLKGKLTC